MLLQVQGTPSFSQLEVCHRWKVKHEPQKPQAIRRTLSYRKGQWPRLRESGGLRSLLLGEVGGRLKSDSYACKDCFEQACGLGSDSRRLLQRRARAHHCRCREDSHASGMEKRP